MSDTQKIMVAIFGVFVVGFIMVGENKTETTQEKEAAAMVRAVAGMQHMAHQKCPKLIKKYTGNTLASLVTKSETDKATYLTLEWTGGVGDNFKKVECTLHVTVGGISKLVIDGKVFVDKDV